MNSTKISFKVLASTKVALVGEGKSEEQYYEDEKRRREERDEPGENDYLKEEDITLERPSQERETEMDSDKEDASDSESNSESSSSSAQANFDTTEKSSHTHVSCIQDAQLSPDGTCIFTTDYERKFSVYPIGSDILEQTATRSLTPYAQAKSTDPIWAFAVNPYFDLNDANTTTVLLGRRDRYISLHNALWDVSRPYDAEEHKSRTEPVNISTKLASYKLIDHTTEAVLAPLSLAYSRDGAYFYAGHKNSIAIFDLSYTQDPILKIPTIPSARNKLKGGGRGFKGHITALSVSPPSPSSNAGILAAGSRTRYVGMYDSVSGEEITHFKLPGTWPGQTSSNDPLKDVTGAGVTHLNWSPDGGYLYIAERTSNAILIYDVRNFSLALGHCANRAGGHTNLTKQKLGFDVWSPTNVYGNQNHEIWAGGMDGKVRVWRNPCLKEGAIKADEVVDVTDGPIGVCLVHPYGNLAVMASGRYESFDSHDEDLGKGKVRGGVPYPRFKEWGCLDILGLSSY